MAAQRSLLLPVAGSLALVAGAAFLIWGPVAAPVASTRAPEPTVPAPVAMVPPIRFSLPQRRVTSPVVHPSNPGLDVSRQILLDVVSFHALDPTNPWAVGHALMVFGPDTQLNNGKRAVPYLFEEYAQRARIGDTVVIEFPRSRGDIRIEPHTDLLLKFFTEIGVPPSETFLVEGEPHTLGELYQHSLWRAWVDARGRTGFDSLGDTPWALQALAAYAPPDFEWQAQQGHPMSMDLLTDVVAADLFAQTRFMREALDAGQTVKKERQGIFSYTCGGAHMMQGAGFAVARGFGSPTARTRVVEQVELLFWRYDVELKIVDDMLEKYPEYAHLLLNQRLKFLGHFLETAHKFAAYGLFEPSEAQRKTMVEGRLELSKTVQTIQAAGLFDRLPDYRLQADTYQLYLDFVGDAAHAIRAIDLSTGAADVLF